VTENLWTEHAAALADAYARDAGTVRFELVTRSLLMHMPPEPQRVVDVGGGFGRQAIMLARSGHSVVIVDFDPNMIAIARDQLSHEPKEVSSRVELVLGDGAASASLVGTDFDLACCHSVLRYQDDATPMLSSLVDLVRQGGLISVLCVNKEASAMRSGLQGRWRDAAMSLEAGRDMDSRHIPGREYTRHEVIAILESAGARVKAWYGVGVFTDHLTENLVVDDPEEVYLVEWLAGNQDPYRQVARCFHIIAERT
jgi:S-adenosylmethionine-dependent methyltransferase